MVWGTYAVNIEAQMSGRSGNKVPQSARLSEGGGGAIPIGQCPNRPCNFFSGASLIPKFINYAPGSKVLHNYGKVLLVFSGRNNCACFA